MSFKFDYSFDSINEGSDWTFSAQAVGGLQTSGSRVWTYRNGTGSPSAGVGPTSGLNATNNGYVYTEASGTNDNNNDTWSMTLNPAFDTDRRDVYFSFWYNQRGDDNNVTAVVEVSENGVGWVRAAIVGGAGDPNKVLSNGTDRWVQRSMNLSDFKKSRATKLRILLDMTATGQTWHNDFALTGFEFNGVNKVQQQSMM